MFRKVIVLLILSVVFMGFSNPVLASRVLATPTADVLSNGTLELDYRYHRGLGSLDVSMGFYPGLNLGLRQDFGGNLFGTVKVAVFEESQAGPGLALGGELSLDKQHLFAVLSSQLGATPGLRGHVGIGFGRYSRGMAGVSMVLNPVQITAGKGKRLPTTSLFMEYDGQGLNGGLAAQFSPDFKANLALAVGHGLSFGLNYKVAF